jgi:hypothetical protein
MEMERVTFNLPQPPAVKPEPCKSFQSQTLNSDLAFGIEAGAQVEAMLSWRQAHIPERHGKLVKERLNGSGPWFDKYIQLRQQLHKGPMIVLLGQRGTGKTQMAVDLLADLVLAGELVRYCKAQDFFREVRSCFRDDGPDEHRFFEKFTRYRGLVIDEAQERGESAWEDRTLIHLIDRRYDSMRATILVSNLSRTAFGEAIGKSVVSRIHESGIVVECDWESFRG